VRPSTDPRPDIELRPASDGEVGLLAGLTVRSEQADGYERALTEDELREELDSDQVLADDVRVALLDGEVVGYVRTFHLPSDVDLERCYVFGDVDPAHRGRGIGRVMLDWGVEHGRAQLLSSGSDLPKFLRVDRLDGAASAHALFARAGFAPVRWTEELLRPLDDLPERFNPRGVRIESWPDDRDEEIRLEKNEAFRDHWGSTPTSPHHWQQLARGVAARPELGCIAVDDSTGAVVGHCIVHRYPSDDAATGRTEAWIQSVGTLREHRGRGVGSAMIAAALHAFVGAGMTHAMIAVDSQNPSGAAQLYRSLGFGLLRRSITHEIRVQ
jgi:mycothiol synthase